MRDYQFRCSARSPVSGGGDLGEAPVLIVGVYSPLLQPATIGVVPVVSLWLFLSSSWLIFAQHLNMVSRGWGQ